MQYLWNFSCGTQAKNMWEFNTALRPREEVNIGVQLRVPVFLLGPYVAVNGKQ
jgi:hypothetical protein